MMKTSDYPSDYVFDRLSSCCGAQPHAFSDDICGACCDHASFVLYDEDENEVEDDSSTLK